MYNRKFLTLACIAVVLGGLGCSSPPTGPPPHSVPASGAVHQATCPIMTEVPSHPQQVIVILIDRSDSYLQADQEQPTRIQADAIALVQQHVPPASWVIGHYISDQSYRESEGFLRGAVPPAPESVPCRVTNIFDPRQKRACQEQGHREATQQACAQAARDRIVAVLRSLSPALTRRTDIWGGLRVTSEIFQAYPTSRKLLIVYSDFEDSVHGVHSPRVKGSKRLQGKRLPEPQPTALPGFRDVMVVVRPPRTATAVHHVPVFHKLLTTWGATVMVRPFEVPWLDILRQGENS